MPTVGLKATVERFLAALEHVEEEHEEVTDTDVREALHTCVTEFVVWGTSADRFPVSFGMFSVEGDRLVGEALQSFVHAAMELPVLKQTAVGQRRLDLLQRADACSPNGTPYVEFLGYRDAPLDQSDLPVSYFEPGDYDEEDWG